MPGADKVKDKCRVVFLPSGKRGEISPGITVLEAAQLLGENIESVCNGRRTCHKCIVELQVGEFQKHQIYSRLDNLSKIDSTETAILDELGKENMRLACATRFLGDAVIYLPEMSRAQKQVIRKTATERIIEISPAIRYVYIEVDEPHLGDHRGDWGRVQEALKKDWGLGDLSIDLFALKKLQKVIREGSWKATVVVWNNKEVIDLYPGYHDGIYGLAVDVGSTSVVAHLCDLRTGDILSTESSVNPQIAFGEDLMSRISFINTNAAGLDKLHGVLIDLLNGMIMKTSRLAKIYPSEIYDLVLVGNTTMTHIFLGLDPQNIGEAPFALANKNGADVKARDLNLKINKSGYVHVLPSQAGHVGADNIAALLAEEPYKHEEITLLIDVGTNAEIVLGNSDWMFSASSPTGPAFEGAQISQGMRAAPGAIERVRVDRNTGKVDVKVIGIEDWISEWNMGKLPQVLPSGMCGSGIIEAIASLFQAGAILGNGRFNPECSFDGLVWTGKSAKFKLVEERLTNNGEPIWITQDDIRNIQLAKAALYAGIKVLFDISGENRVDKIVLAGAFGSFIDKEYAMILGLIPDCELENVSSVGNAAGDGARIALLNNTKRKEAEELSNTIKYIETAVAPNFQEWFVDAIHIPHSKDQFENIRDKLPIQSASVPRERNRKFIRPSRQGE